MNYRICNSDPIAVTNRVYSFKLYCCVMLALSYLILFFGTFFWSIFSCVFLTVLLYCSLYDWFLLYSALVNSIIVNIFIDKNKKAWSFTIVQSNVVDVRYSIVHPFYFHIQKTWEIIHFYRKNIMLYCMSIYLNAMVNNTNCKHWGKILVTRH